MRKFVLCLIVPSLSLSAFGQSLLVQYPGFTRYQEVRKVATQGLRTGLVRVAWSSDGSKAVFSTKSGSYQAYDFAKKEVSETAAQKLSVMGDPEYRFGTGPFFQFVRAVNPVTKEVALQKSGDVYLVNGNEETPLTAGLPREGKVEFGKFPWVYCEELGQADPLMWSPDGKFLALYRFDQSKVPLAHTLQKMLTAAPVVQSEPYPRVGGENPKVDLLIWSAETKKFVTANLHTDSDPMKDVGHYVYSAAWAPDGKSLIAYRLDRRQEKKQIVRVSPETGQVNVLANWERKEGWFEANMTGDRVRTTPEFYWKSAPTGSNQFIVISDASGFRNFELYDTEKGFVRTLTQHRFDVRDIVRYDPERDELWYTTQGDTNPYLVQLWRLDSKGKATRLTDPSLSHRVSVSPASNGFFDTAQSLSQPPLTTLRDRNGKELQVLARTDMKVYSDWGGVATERFTVLAADGKTLLYGKLMKPSNFDPSRKYPLLLDCYGGPNAGTDEELFEPSSPMTEFGFVCAWVDGRGSKARGTAFKFALDGNVGVAEVQDQVAAVKRLSLLPFIDSTRIGIHGGSYGGEVVLHAMSQYPDLFTAGVASSPGTDLTLYDTIYTERYLGLPTENENAYTKQSVLNEVKNLTGNLLLYFGTADYNVLPTHSYKLIQALDRAGKRYELAIGPDQGHSLIEESKLIDFFVRKLKPVGKKG